MAKTKFNNDDLASYYQKIYSELEASTKADDYGNYILTRIKGGQKTVLNKTQSEIRNFDMSFLDVIESVYPAILKIMRDPKKTIRYDEEIVAVEKAKKVNSQTVRHLSSHTHLIKEITKEGEVIPSKVLTTFAEEELAIYENRFIKSLVKRMEMFLERRYEVMKVSLESFETERLNVVNKFLMSGQEVTVTLDIAIKNDLTVNVETTKEQYNRLLYVREMVQALKGTEFMRALAKARDVVPPIMKTNIILHNPDFKLAYGLWLYLDRVDGISTNIDIKEKSYKYSAVFDNDINQCMTIALASFIKNRAVDGIHASKKLPQMKAPKPEMNEELELELNLEADNKKLEDYTMNELLLSQTAKFFEASMEGMKQTGNKYNESVRVVYRQMLDMLDQIYPKAFGVTDEELESKDLYEQLEYARRRMMIFKIVRQQKQMNIARMGKEEKRIEKLITKLEEKIRVSEQRERERQERERAREEARRLAESEKRRAENQRKRKLEREAIKNQKAVERALLDAKKQTEINDIKHVEQRVHILPLAEKKRKYLMMLKLQEDKAKETEAVEEVKTNDDVIPIRRRDEFDDLTDEELRQLMAENELLHEETDDDLEPIVEEVQPQEEEKPKPKKKKKKPVEAKEEPKKAKEEPKPAEAKEEDKPKPKKKNSGNIEDMSDEELEALISGMNDFTGADLRGIDEEEPPLEEKPKTKKSKKKENASNATIKKKNTEEQPQEEEATPINFEEMSDEELEALFAENDLSGIETGDAELDNAPPIEASANLDTQPEEEIPAMSDEEFEKLMAENGVVDDSSNPDETEENLEEPIEEPQETEVLNTEDVLAMDADKEELENKKKKPTDTDPDSDFDDLSDEELEALMESNGLF